MWAAGVGSLVRLASRPAVPSMHVFARIGCPLLRPAIRVPLFRFGDELALRFASSSAPSSAAPVASPSASATTAEASVPSAAAKRPQVNENDISEQFVKGFGKGGQKVNKTSSCVILRHEPSGIVVKTQATRSLQQNRNIARRLLREKLDEMVNGAESRRARKAEKVRKQKDRRRRRREQHVTAQAQVKQRQQHLQQKQQLQPAPHQQATSPSKQVPGVDEDEFSDEESDDGVFVEEEDPDRGGPKY